MNLAILVCSLIPLKAPHVLSQPDYALNLSLKRGFVPWNCLGVPLCMEQFFGDFRGVFAVKGFKLTRRTTTKYRSRLVGSPVFSTDFKESEGRPLDCIIFLLDYSETGQLISMWSQ